MLRRAEGDDRWGRGCFWESGNVGGDGCAPLPTHQPRGSGTCRRRERTEDDTAAARSGTTSLPRNHTPAGGGAGGPGPLLPQEGRRPGARSGKRIPLPRDKGPPGAGGRFRRVGVFTASLSLPPTGLGVLGLKTAAPSHLIPQVRRDVGSWPYLTDGEAEAWNRQLVSADPSRAGQRMSTGGGSKTRTRDGGAETTSPSCPLAAATTHPRTARLLPRTELVACGHAGCLHLWELDSGIKLSSQK